MHDDLDDTILIPGRAASAPVGGAGDIEDTIIRMPSAPSVPEDEADDTIIRPRSVPRELEVDGEDTIIRVRRSDADADAAPAPAIPRAPLAPVSTALIGFSVGDRVVPLDRVCLVGRHPSAPRIVTGEPPLLVKVASPRSQVSSTHLEMRAADYQVVVTDLRSTNGTTITVAGSNPRKLRQGESVVVGVGALVDIGDDIILTVVAISAADREKTP